MAYERCQEILASAGFPTNILLLDFETFFDDIYSLKKMSTIEYITDPQFECLGFGEWHYPDYKYDDGASNFYDKSHIQGRLNFFTGEYGDNLENVTLVVQNCFFDPMILSWHFDIHPSYVVDIRHLDRHFDARRSHKLADMAEHHHCSSSKGDTQQFKGLHWRDIAGNPQHELPLTDYCLNDIMLETELFLYLLPQISRPEVELKLMNHTAQLYLYPELELDPTKARILIPRMMAAMNKGVRNYDKKEISGTISFAKKLQDALPAGEMLPVKPGKPTKNMIPITGKGLIPAVSKSDPGIDELKYHNNEEVRKLINARLAIKSWPLHIARVQGLIKQARARDWKLGIPLHYYGGHTGRASGAEGINVQNFAARVDPLMAETKKCIVAPKGKTLIIKDLSQIECRYLAYMAGQDDLLDCFTRSGDPYSELATDIFKEEVRKPKDDDSKELYDKLFLRRYIGKQAELGLGYGMGDNRFFEQIQEYDVVRKLVKQGEIKKKFAEDVVKLYRKKRKAITKFWSEVEKCFRWVIKYPHESKEMECGLQFWKRGSTVYIRLPSGRILYYPHCTYHPDRGIKWHYGHLWGGTLVENIIQAIARDIFMEQVLECEDLGIIIVMHVHDSLIACVDEDDNVDGISKQIREIMTTPPKWSPGIPLDIDEKVSKCYS